MELSHQSNTYKIGAVILAGAGEESIRSSLKSKVSLKKNLKGGSSFLEWVKRDVDVY